MNPSLGIKSFRMNSRHRKKRETNVSYETKNILNKSSNKNIYIYYIYNRI